MLKAACEYINNLSETVFIAGVMAGSVAVLVLFNYLLSSPASPLSAHKIEMADVATEAAAVKSSMEWIDGFFTTRIYLSGLPAMPEQDVVEVFARAIAISRHGKSLAGSGCIFHLGGGAGEVDLRFALAVVDRADMGKVCLDDDLRIFDGSTRTEAELLGRDIPPRVYGRT